MQWYLISGKRYHFSGIAFSDNDDEVFLNLAINVDDTILVAECILSLLIGLISLLLYMHIAYNKYMLAVL